MYNCKDDLVDCFFILYRYKGITLFHEIYFYNELADAFFNFLDQ